METRAKIQYIFSTGKRMQTFVHNQMTAAEQEENNLCTFLSGMQLQVALRIYETGPLALGGLAEHLGVTPPSASTMVERLVEKRVLTREPDQNDRRKVVIDIHPEARPLMDDMHDRFRQAFQDLIEAVGVDTVDQWFDVMRRVEQVLVEKEETYG